MTRPQGKTWDFRHFWDAPHRPLFLASFLCAFLTVAWWPLGVGIGFPGLRPVVLWHVHELIFGFAGAAIGGYLLTALPSWTARPPVRGTLLKVLLLFWGLARLVTAMAGHVPLGLLIGLNAAFFLWLAGILIHQTITSGTFRKAGFGVAVLALGSGEALFLAAAMSGRAWISLTVAHIVLVGIALLMTIVGARAIPAFTNNWLVRTGQRDLEIRDEPSTRHLAQGLLIAVIISLLINQPGVAHIAMICAAAATLWNMRRWRLATSLSNPLLVALYLAYLWLPIGLAGVGILWFYPTIYPVSDAIHAFTIGAMSGLIMAIAGRAASHHESGDLRANRGYTMGVLMIWLATLLRLIVPLFVGQSGEVQTVAALIWCAGWVIFIVGFLPALWGPAPRPVLSGRKHQITAGIDI